MTLVAPDPVRMVPLPLREQADVRDRWLTQRLLDLLPELMDRAGIDLWLVVGRESNEDPVLATLLPATWLSGRRRTILVLHRSDDGATAMALSPYRSASSSPPGRRRKRPTCRPNSPSGPPSGGSSSRRTRCGSASTSRSPSRWPTGSPTPSTGC